MDTDSVVVLITTPSREEGERIATVLVEDGLAACVNLVEPLTSIYRWQGDVLTEKETLLLCKTRREGLEERFIPAVLALHTYENPEIIALPILAGSAAYLGWIRDETRQP